jgi:hypothetical protein
MRSIDRLVSQHVRDQILKAKLCIGQLELGVPENSISVVSKGSLGLMFMETLP